MGSQYSDPVVDQVFYQDSCCLLRSRVAWEKSTFSHNFTRIRVLIAGLLSSVALRDAPICVF
jgi:hypothetical protein